MPQLVSPGVSVTVSDESFFAGAGEGTIPLIVFATQQNKPNTDDSDPFLTSTIATGTLPEEAGKLRLITSQRELIQTYGEPIFAQEAGTPLHGDELNEYGLHAAFQYLGIADRAFIIRADVPMEEIIAQDDEPVGPPLNGTHWLDLANTQFGIFQGDLTQWVPIVPLLLELDVDILDDSIVNTSGVDGEFAIDIGNNLLGLFEKVDPTATTDTWYRVGSSAWQTAVGVQNRVGGGTGTVDLTYAPHNEVPVFHDRNVWVKITNPDLGADYVVKVYNSTTQIFTQLFAPLFVNDAEAIDEFGTNLVAGSIYVQYDPAKATHLLKRYNGTNFVALVFEAKLTPPTTDAPEGRLWYSTDFDVDIMAGDGQNWFGYLNRFPTTDPNGPILSATAPITQSDGTALVDNDLWIDTGDLENYPLIYRWTTSTLEFVLINNADQTTPEGIVFADTREIGGIAGLSSNTLDSDAPDARLYPSGTLLFNLRYSTLNVKERVFDAASEGTIVLGDFVPSTAVGDRWVTKSGLKSDGSPFMGRKAQRRVVVVALQSEFASNQDIRSEFIFFNLMAAPGYCELMDEMLTLNVDIKEVAFVVGDVPSRLAPDGTSIQNYALNAAGTPVNGEDGRTSGVRNFNTAQWYPWGLSTNLDGSEIMIPSSTIALRTIAFNDQVAFPWFAPAGLNRGLVTNAQSVGFLTSEGEFERIILNPGQRDVLYLNNINPISDQPNRGLIVFGQKTLSPVTSALDRINVARLIEFLRVQLEELMKPFLFEPNDAETRESVTISVERLLGDLLGKRALADFGVRCDETNNTPIRIDRNELWCDVAIIPIKAVEFIYVPIRILNTGEAIN